MKDSEVISTAIEYVLLLPQTRITDVIFNSELTAMSASSVFAVTSMSIRVVIIKIYSRLTPNRCLLVQGN
jgi:hypothetical protein